MQKLRVGGDSATAYDLEQLLSQETCESSLSNSQQAYPKSKMLMSPDEICRTDLSWKLSPSDCHTLKQNNKCRVSTSTPRAHGHKNNFANLLNTRHIIPEEEKGLSYDDRPANWNRHSQSEDYLCYEMQNSSYREHQKSGVQNRCYSSDIKYSQQRNSLQDYMQPNNINTKPNKKTTHQAINNSNTQEVGNNKSAQQIARNTARTGWDSHCNAVALNISDTEAFPSMNKSSASKNEKKVHKKKRIKPTRVVTTKLEATNVQIESINSSDKDLLNNVNNAFLRTDVSNSTSLEYERKMLRQMKATLKKKADSLKDDGFLNYHLFDIKFIEPKMIMHGNVASHLINNPECSPDNVVNVTTLNDLISVYSYLVLYNHVPSLMLELYFTLQLLTARGCHVTTDCSRQQIFSSIDNCVYFASHVLWSLRDVLQLLDRATLRLLCDNRRLELFIPELPRLLGSVVGKAPQILAPKQPPRSPMKGVPFQADTDNRDNFPNNSTFHIFRKQRDHFYEVSP